MAEQPPKVAGGQIPEDVLVVAARLFSELGYDQVTTEFIANACGVDTTMVRDAYGGKRGIYLAVIEWLTRERMEFLAPVVATFTPDADGLIRLIDRILDWALEHRDLQSIWIHRWMSDAIDFPDLEMQYGRPPVAMLTEKVAEAIDDAKDPELFTWQTTWTISGFVRGGYVGADGTRRHVDDPKVLDRFRRYLHQTARCAAAR
ncbi:TetR/AcrR family transcriptional regulator [Actinomadura montaniterrae]|uniref:TetR/AcrR family transcriptional regulator n=1 Tax=Actinomadura montaniterrae TaxID=1803903 RepID=UPI00178C3F4C|nr:TetR/AcrR family transcriptional regulator [Actinomadura montaniterrae]